jgi:hypothetical protein
MFRVIQRLLLFVLLPSLAHSHAGNGFKQSKLAKCATLHAE